MLVAPRLLPDDVRSIIPPATIAKSKLPMPAETEQLETTDPKNHRQRTPRAFGKLAWLGLVAGIMAISYWAVGDRLSLNYLAEQEAELRAYRQDAPFWAALIAIVLYICVAGFSIPGATVLTLACGWIFGFWLGLLVVSLGSTGGATLAFLLTRYFLQNWVQQRFAKRLLKLNAAFEREGAFYLFTLRLIPAVPFFVINAVMGLTKIRVSTFWWVSQLGMLPATAAYVYAGSSVPSLQQLAEQGVGQLFNWQLLLALAILGLLPLVIKRTVARLAPTQPGPASESADPHAIPENKS